MVDNDFYNWIVAINYSKRLLQNNMNNRTLKNSEYVE